MCGCGCVGGREGGREGCWFIVGDSAKFCDVVISCIVHYRSEAVHCVHFSIMTVQDVGRGN